MISKPAAVVAAILVLIADLLIARTLVGMRTAAPKVVILKKSFLDMLGDLILIIF